MTVCIECTRNPVSTSHSRCHSWNTCHVKLLAHDLFTTVHRFVYFGCHWNAVTGLSSKLHLSDTCPLSYQLSIPVNTSSMFCFLDLSFSHICTSFFTTKTLTRETVLYINFIVYCQFFIAVSSSTPLVSCLVALPFSFFLSLSTSQPSGPISGKAISPSPRL